VLSAQSCSERNTKTNNRLERKSERKKQLDIAMKRCYVLKIAFSKSIKVVDLVLIEYPEKNWKVPALLVDTQLQIIPSIRNSNYCQTLGLGSIIYVCLIVMV
jgi:hypothetical protein